jgi:peptidoglycan/xylan/chitin deacetylase (PgdA/CDA1 family)
MSLKHRLKLGLREAYARVLFHSGLHALVNALLPRRLVILAGHCVKPEHGEWPAGRHLSADMWIGEAQLKRIVRWFAPRYDVVSIGDGVAKLGGKGKSLLALSFDDGYRDNALVLGPLVERNKVGATVFLESRPLDERRVNWSHKYFWLLEKLGPEALVERYGAHAGDTRTFITLNQMIAESRGNERYHLKRILKYDAPPAERDRALDRAFVEAGGDEARLCEELYMTWDEARGLAAHGVELGGHTVSHAILSKLPPDEQRREIADGALSLERALGRAPVTFAYPWGRRWDYDDSSRKAAKDAGFACAVNMHAGINRPESPRYDLRRVAIDGSAKLHLLVAEACGGFELLRKIGIDLGE